MFACLIEGIMEFKSFLNFNFVENETHLKRTLNDALNGKLPQSSNKTDTKKSEINNLEQ